LFNVFRQFHCIILYREALTISRWLKKMTFRLVFS
jgi:hypothetical protein